MISLSWFETCLVNVKSTGMVCRISVAFLENQTYNWVCKPWHKPLSKVTVTAQHSNDILMLSIKVYIFGIPFLCQTKGNEPQHTQWNFLSVDNL